MKNLYQYPYPVTTLLAISMIAITVLAWFNKAVRQQLILHPVSVVKEREYNRLLTSDFIHHDGVHLILNIYLLITYGGGLEGYLRQTAKNGSLLFLGIYLASCLSGSIATTIINRKDSGFSSAGASGSLMGCIFSYILLQHRRVAFYLPGIGAVNNLYFGIICMVLLTVYQIRSKNEVINQEQHFFGAIGGALMTLCFFPGIIK